VLCGVAPIILVGANGVVQAGRLSSPRPANQDPEGWVRETLPRPLPAAPSLASITQQRLAHMLLTWTLALKFF